MDKKLLVTKASGLEAIASRLEAITTSNKKLLVTKAFLWTSLAHPKTRTLKLGTWGGQAQVFVPSSVLAPSSKPRSH